MSAKRYLIIGDGAAGTTAAQYLRTADPKATIAIISDDPAPAYYRAALTNYLLGELREEQIFAVPPTFYDEFEVHRALARVASVDTKRSCVMLAQGGKPVAYDALVVGAGSRARAPTFEGNWLPGVMTMRTLQDVRNVMDLIKLRGLRHAVVVGGGPLGLEWAHGLVVRGVKVTMVLRDPKFMAGAMDDVASDLLLARLKHAGVGVRMRDEIVAVLPGQDGRAAGVALKSGERMACDLVAVGIGVVCNSEFLQSSGLTIDKNGGIAVDDAMRTNVSNVFAAGDIASYKGKLLQLWEPAKMQARVVAANISNRPTHYQPGTHYMATRLYDLDFAGLGESGGATAPGTEELVRFPQGTGQIEYRKIMIRDSRVVGALMLGEREARVRRHGRALKTLIDKKIDVSGIKDEMLDPAFDLASWVAAHEAANAPKQMRQGTLAAGAKLRGTNAINLADLPPLPVGGKLERKDGPAPGTQAFQAFGGPELPPPTLFLQGPQGRIEVKPPSAILGRDPQACQLPINDPAVSHVHAEITIQGQSAYIRDLGSASGTWVNNSPINIPKKLRNGDKLRLGKTELTVALEGGAPQSTYAPSLGGQASAEPTPHLDVRSGRSLGLAFELTISPTLIGRDPASQIRLDDEWIDWQHAFLRKQGNVWELSDAQSHGVTKKNGVVLEPGNWVPLAPGDVVEVGHVVLAYSLKHSLLPSVFGAPKSMLPQVSPMDPHAQSRTPSAPPPTPRSAPSGQPPPMTSMPGTRPSAYGPPPGPVPPAPGSQPRASAPPPSMPPRHGTAQSPVSLQGMQMRTGAPGGPSMQPHMQTAGPGAPSAMQAAQAAMSGAPRRARLSIRQGPGAGSIAELADMTVIGADPRQCTLVVPDPYVGPRHVEITRFPHGFFARDLGTPAGTSCRGQRLGPQPFALQNGDVIVLGNNVALLFEVAQ